MALLVAALGILSDWPFEVPTAKSMVSQRAKCAADLFGELLSVKWRGFLAEAGLWTDPSGRWTQDLILKRANQRIDVELSDAELALAELALRATFAEFKDNWAEFCVVGTGALHWYPIGPEGLGVFCERLARVSDDSRRTP